MVYMQSLFKRRHHVLFFVAVLIVSMWVTPMVSLAQVETAPAEVETAPAEVAAAVARIEPGNPSIGRMLFTGQKRFTNGGPPCMSCHSAGVGALGGGVLGPNLQNIYASPKNPLLNIAWVNSPGIPVMGPIWSNRNVTQEEMGDLRAFFEMQSKQSVSGTKTGSVVGIGIAGFVGLLIFVSLVWSGRYRNRCRGTAHEAIWRNYGGKGGR